MFIRSVRSIEHNNMAVLTVQFHLELIHPHDLSQLIVGIRFIRKEEVLLSGLALFKLSQQIRRVGWFVPVKFHVVVYVLVDPSTLHR